MSEGTLSKSSGIRPQQLFYWLMLLAVLILASAVVIEYNNSVRSAPIYLFLLIFGIAITSAFGMVQGGLLALLLVSMWITIKQVTGVWSGDRLLLNLIEIVTVTFTFLTTGQYRRRLQLFLSAYAEAQTQLKKLDLEDRAVGLIKPPVGLLRLKEEEERSVRYKRPFSLVLILMQPALDGKLSTKDSIGLMRALAATIKDTTRDVDIPFLAAPNKVALILPETDTSGANKVVSNIVKHLLDARFISQAGIGAPIRDFAQIRFGFAAFLGRSNAKIDMLEAAESSLQKSLETNSTDLFQNLFIEWTTLGESHISSPLIGADLRVPPDARAEAAVEEDSPDAFSPPENRAKSAIERLIDRLRSI